MPRLHKPHNVKEKNIETISYNNVRADIKHLHLWKGQVHVCLKCIAKQPLIHFNKNLFSKISNEHISNGRIKYL